MAIIFRQDSLQVLQGGMTNVEFANKLSLDYSTIHLLKKGKIKPGHIIIEAILKAYPHIKFEDVFLLSG